MSKDSSPKHFQSNKERLQIKIMKDIKVFPKKKNKKKSDNMVVSNTKIYQKLVSIEKDVIKSEKTTYHNYFKK